MKKIFSLIFALFISMNSYADGMYGCVMDVAGGFNWKNGEWSFTRIVKENLTLKVTNGNRRIDLKFAKEEVVYQFDVCTSTGSWNKEPFITCSNNFGATVVFSEKSQKGGYSALNGAASMNSSYKDTMMTAAFSCQKF